MQMYRVVPQMKRVNTAVVLNLHVLCLQPFHQCYKCYVNCIFLVSGDIYAFCLKCNWSLL